MGMRSASESTGVQDAKYWDRWWRDRLSKDAADVFPAFPAPILRYKGGLIGPVNSDIVNSDELLIAAMREFNLRTVLCAGNGVSQEPRALAEAGLDVTALDISSVAVRFAEEFQYGSHRGDSFCTPRMHRPGGSVKFIVGDLLDSKVCPGPFDVIIERRTIQVLALEQRAAALSALANRLGDVGILQSLCLDDPFPPELGWSQHPSGLFHASQSWFQENGWPIWDGLPNSMVAGRVAWLVRCGSMKPPPKGLGADKPNPSNYA
jgi:hypothetical protein